MSDVIRIKKSTVSDLLEVKEILEKNFPLSLSLDISDSQLIDLCVSEYLKILKSK